MGTPVNRDFDPATYDGDVMDCFLTPEQIDRVTKYRQGLAAIGTVDHEATTAAIVAAAAAPALAVEAPKAPGDVVLDFPIRRGEQVIGSVRVRKPGSGELRGLTLLDLSKLDVDTLHKLLPRITVPPLTAPEVKALDPADLMQLGAEVMDFLLPNAVRATAE